VNRTGSTHNHYILFEKSEKNQGEKREQNTITSLLFQTVMVKTKGIVLVHGKKI